MHQKLLQKKHSTYVVALLLACIIGASVFAFSKQDAYATVATQEELLHDAQLATIENSIFIEENRHLLSILAALPEVQGTDTKSCTKLMGELIQTNTEYVNIGVLNANGDLLCSGLPFTPPVNASKSVYFQRVIESDGFAVGDFQQGAVSHQTVLAFGYPVHDSSGKIVRVIALAVNLTWLGDFVKDAQIPNGTTLTLVDNQGKVLARYPATSPVGQQAPEISMPVDNVIKLESNYGETLSHDAEGNSYYLIAVPLKRNAQEGFLHLIMSIPSASINK